MTKKTDAQRRAQKKYLESLADRGVKTITLRVLGSTHKRLSDLAKSYGSQSKAIDAIIGGE